MKIEAILDEIEKDSKIDLANLDGESIKIPFLHSKYYRIFIEEIKILKSLDITFGELKRARTEYYLGKAADSVYREEPLDYKILRSDLDLYLNADHRLLEIEKKREIQKIKVNALEAFIKQINQRSFNIKNAVDFLKFKNGLA